MSLPTLTPTSTQSAIVLPQTASFNGAAPINSEVIDACPIGAYSGSAAFVTGAIAQVAFTYKRLGGDVLDLEITSGSVFANYEEAVLEYSYIVNQHQAKNVIGSALGGETGSFNHKGDTTDGPDGYALKYPRFSFETSFRIGDSFGTEAGIGGTTPVYSASISTQAGKQDYDLQQLVSSSAFNTDNADSPYYNKMVNNPRVKIRKMYYVSPQQMWRFYGYYGGLNVVGNFHNYGQYADDSSFQVIPAWHNKLQAISYEDHLYTRTSHYSYEIINNKLRIFPIPTSVSPEKFWFKFTIENGDIWSDTGVGQDGVNNINTIPFENIPYEKINSMGQQWIRRFALALSKETLGQIRGKFGGSIPIPGDNVTLNASDLLGQAKEEQTALKEELRKLLEETEYSKLIAADKEMTNNAVDIMNESPMGIFVG
tara:strand:- start:595 stop:1872 length:1278 start_codon:yes stop_codon:yes gene_type:complete